VAKHSSARVAKVSIERNGDRVQVVVEDNGVGFNLATLTPGVDTNSKFGLFSIRERLEPLGGNMEITSEPGHGTRVSLSGPLMNDSEKQEMAA
jgi:signal transduction histidine kinase